MSENEILKYGNNVHWTFPLLFEFEPVYSALYQTFKDYGINLSQAFLYGAPKTIWGGGRIAAMQGEFDRATLLRVLSYVYDQNAIPTFTFSCMTITEDDLKDRYANFILDTALEMNCNFIVYSDMLRDYIKSKKSDACVISSVIKPYIEFQGDTRNQEATVENETAYYNRLLKEYDIVVVRPEYSMGPLQENPNLIDDLSRIEVLINQTCATDCYKAHAHYRLLEDSNRPTNNDGGAGFRCVRDGIPLPISLKDSLIHTEAQIKRLVDAGVQHLKLKGRGEYRYSYDALMLMLAHQMFRADGPGYFILRDAAAGRVEQERQRFFGSLPFNQNPQQNMAGANV